MIDDTFAQAVRMDAPRAMALCLSLSGHLDYQEGKWDRAETDLRRACSMYQKIGASDGECLARTRLGALLTAQGRFDEAMEHLNASISSGERAPMRAHYLTRAYATIASNRLTAGDLEGAAQHMAAGRRELERHGRCVTCAAILLPDAVRVDLALGKIEQAEQRVTELEAIARKFESPAWTAMAQQARGRLEAARGAPDVAARAFQEAGQRFRTSGALYDAALAQLLEAGALQPSHPERSVALESAAKATLKTLGAFLGIRA